MLYVCLLNTLDHRVSTAFTPENNYMTPPPSHRNKTINHASTRDPVNPGREGRRRRFSSGFVTVVVVVVVDIDITGTTVVRPTAVNAIRTARDRLVFSRVLAAAAGPLSPDRRRRHHGRLREEPQGHQGRAVGRRAVRAQRAVPVRAVRAGRGRRVDRRGGHRGGDVQDGGEREQRARRRRPAQARADHHRGALRRAAVRTRDEAQVQARPAVPRKGQYCRVDRSRSDGRPAVVPRTGARRNGDGAYAVVVADTGGGARNRFETACSISHALVVLVRREKKFVRRFIQVFRFVRDERRNRLGYSVLHENYETANATTAFPR